MTNSMDKIDDKQLSKILSDVIIHRETIDDSKSGRIIEKVECTSRGSILIKYGYDSGVRDEVLIYEMITRLTRLSKNEFTPTVYVSKQTSDEMYFLALEWVNGNHPDFTKHSDISIVFTVLGKWAAKWSKLTHMFDKEFLDPLNQHQQLKKLLYNNQSSLREIMGDYTIDLLCELESKSEMIIRNLKRMPNTLDPGDISLHNMITNGVNEERRVTFIDFESASIRPMSMMFEHFGEGYESIPYTREGIDLAMKSFLTAWNEHSDAKVQWHDFGSSQICAMAYYKMGEYVYWIERILIGRKVEKTLGWIKQKQESLIDLLARLEY